MSGDRRTGRVFAERFQYCVPHRRHPGIDPALEAADQVAGHVSSGDVDLERVPLLRRARQLDLHRRHIDRERPDGANLTCFATCEDPVDELPQPDEEDRAMMEAQFTEPSARNEVSLMQAPRAW